LGLLPGGTTLRNRAGALTIVTMWNISNWGKDNLHQVPNGLSPALTIIFRLDKKLSKNCKNPQNSKKYATCGLLVDWRLHANGFQTDIEFYTSVIIVIVIIKFL